MTKDELIKKNIQLEEELHVANNSIEYWQEETKAYQKLYYDLQENIDNEIVMSFLNTCSIVDKQKLEDFILNL